MVSCSMGRKDSYLVQTPNETLLIRSIVNGSMGPVEFVNWKSTKVKPVEIWFNVRRG